jgi:hypothetical protein
MAGNIVDLNGKEVDRRTHPEVRRETAETIFRELRTAMVPTETALTPETEESVIYRIEKMLIMGEQRGVNEVKNRLIGIINQLRSQHTDGVANHIEQALRTIHQWHVTSADFLTAKELKEAKEAGLVKSMSDAEMSSLIPTPIVDAVKN